MELYLDSLDTHKGQPRIFLTEVFHKKHKTGKIYPSIVDNYPGFNEWNPQFRKLGWLAVLKDLPFRAVLRISALTQKL